jgi:SAM-dependent methyltransferase
MTDITSHRGEGLLVSIILPTFNRAGRIGAAIRSVITQTHRTWELLVIDDASTDDTASIVASYADPRIFLVTLPFNCGSPARPRNIGLQLARGDYVAYIDDDNTWRPEHLQHLLAAILARPGAVAAYGGKAHHLPDGRMEEVCAADQGIDTQDGLHARTALTALPEGWVGADFCHEDAEFWGKIRARWPGQVVWVPEILSDYNIHAEQRYNTGYQNTRMYDCAYYARNPSYLADARVRRRFLSVICAIGPANVLDVGCGQGWLLADLNQAGIRAWGADPSADLAAICRAPGPIVRARADALPCSSWDVDLLVCLDVLPQIPEPRLERSLREFARVARRFLFALDLGNVAREGQRTLHPADWWLVRCAAAGIGLTAVQPISELTVLVSR